jgi:hypothetical protein
MTARIAALLTVTFALALPAAAQACDAGTHQSAHTGPGGTRAPLLLGDSTSIFAVPHLAALGIEADAHGCRQVYQGLDIERGRRHAHTLPALLILALSANGGATSAQIDTLRHDLGPTRVLALVTPKEPGAAAAVMRAQAAAHPRDTILIDWARFSAPHPEWFAGDGLHVGEPGAQAYAAFIRQAVDPLMPPRPSALGLPRTTRTATKCGAHTYVLRGAKTMSCTRAKQLTKRSPLQPIPGYRAYDWGALHQGSWASVYRRTDGKVLVATR